MQGGIIKMHKEDKIDIEENLDNIREECDKIEEKIKPKKVQTRGDPIVKIIN